MTAIKKNVSHQSTEGKKTHTHISRLRELKVFAQLESDVKIAWQFLCSCHQCLLCEIQNMKKGRQQNSCLDHCDLSVTILALSARNSLNISGTNSLIKIKYTYPLCK